MFLRAIRAKLLASSIFKFLGFSVLLALMVLLAMLSYYRTTPENILVQSARLLANSVLRQIHTEELDQANKLAARFELGYFDGSTNPADTWKAHSKQSKYFALGSYNGPIRTNLEVPFVFEKYDAPHIKALRNQFELERLSQAPLSEYQTILKVANWSGRLWDHGVDMPLDGPNNFKAIDVIKAAKSRGNRYWCEVSARTTSQVATALGWPSRVITLSNDGYHWNHAVTEIWSNEFAKWLVVDNDFNVVYESNGVPLSSFELVTEGHLLQALGRLQIRQIAPMKRYFMLRGGRMREMQALQRLIFYNYAHVDMRNDWPSRHLSKGSPAGGDLATYHTSNKLIPPVLSATRRAINKRYFDWPVNLVEIHLDKVSVDNDLTRVEVDLKAYGPYASHIEIKVDDLKWQKVDPGAFAFKIASGLHELGARLILLNGGIGPVTKIEFATTKSGMTD